MTHAVSSSGSSNFWERNFSYPRPTQDSDFLKQVHFIPGVKEILMLRQVHALEHGTVWVLSENYQKNEDLPPHPDNESLGGLSTDQGFYLYGEVSLSRLKRAVNSALQRFRQGEWELAIHPRCGTNLSVAMMLTAGFAVGTHLLFPRGFMTQLLGLGLATTTATQVAPDLGNLAQKYITTAVPFNLEVVEISSTSDMWGRSAHFVRLRWRDLQ